MNSGRLFQILYLLIKEKKITAKTLAEHFEVSERTIYRDIDRLSAAGIPVYTLCGKEGGLCISEDFILSHSLLSDKEQDEVLSALSSATALGGLEGTQALGKLSALFHRKKPDWLEVDFSGWGSQTLMKERFALLKKAIFDEEIVIFDYYNTAGERRRRKVLAQKLVFKGQAWYLYGYCLEKEDFRIFKLSRIRQLEKADCPVEQQRLKEKRNKESGKERPRKETQEISYQVKMQEIVIRGEEALGYRFFDEFAPEEITRKQDGSLIVRTWLPAEEWVYDYIQGMGDRAQLLEPEYMREILREKIKKNLEQYL